MKQKPETEASTDQESSQEVLEFPVEFADAVAKIQAAAASPDKKKTDRGDKVFRSIHDLYLARAR